MRDAFGGGMCTVRGTERVVDIDVAEAGERLRKLRIVRGFTRMESQVFQQQHVAGSKPRCTRLDVAADTVGREVDGTAEQLRETRGHGTQAEGGVCP